MKKSIADSPQEEPGPHQPSQLFLLRVRIARANENQGPEDLAGKVQDPVSGQVQYFRGGMELVRILHRTISQKEASSPAETPESRPA